MAGTDARATLVRLIMLVVTAAVVGLTILRVAGLAKRPAAPVPRSPGLRTRPPAPLPRSAPMPIDTLLDPVAAGRDR